MNSEQNEYKNNEVNLNNFSILFFLDKFSISSVVVVKRYDVQYDPFSHSLLLLRRYEIFACYVQGLGRNMTLCEKVELLFFFKKATKHVDPNNNYPKTDLMKSMSYSQLMQVMLTFQPHINNKQTSISSFTMCSFSTV